MKWTNADEAQLEEMKEFNIDLKDTALGRHCATMKRQLFASVATMTPEEREELQLELESYNEVSPSQCAEKDPPCRRQILQRLLVLVGR